MSMPDSSPLNDPDVKTYSVISMFSGCGGMDLGFLGGFTALGEEYGRHPFDIVWANDNDESACKTYKHNLGHEINVGDVWDALDSLPDSADVIVGGFPCQDVSLNGKREGINGHRSSLYRAMVAAVERVKPKVFVAENVKGLLMQYNEGALKQVIKEFSALGYNVTYKLYNAADYGVAQARERVFIVGTLDEVGDFNPPAPVRNEDGWVTAQEAVEDLEDVPEKGVPNHIWSRAKKSPEQGNRQLDADRPAHTIRAECHGNIQFHYKLPRRISMREAARFQSFPDDFVFQAKLRKTERQVGNAVPPVLAWYIAGAVRACLSDQIPEAAASSSDASESLSSVNNTSDGVQLSPA